jgi:predicted transposase/invertase (TIGR01784 family)
MRSTLLPTNDLVFKLLFGRPGSERALINLLSDVLRPASPIAAVQVLNPAVEPQTLREKAIVLDLLVRLADGTRVHVEMQTAQIPGFTDRMLLYWARAYAAQAVRGSQYTDLAPAISIIFTCFADAADERLHDVYRLMGLRGRVFSDKQRLHVIALPLRDRPGALGEGEEALLAWANFLGATTDEEVKEAVMSNPNLEPAAEALLRLSADEEVQQLAEERERALIGYAVTMGAARAEGRALGRAEGRAEGHRDVPASTRRAMTSSSGGPIGSSTASGPRSSWPSLRAVVSAGGAARPI